MKIFFACLSLFAVGCAGTWGGGNNSCQGVDKLSRPSCLEKPIEPTMSPVDVVGGSYRGAAGYAGRAAARVVSWKATQLAVEQAAKQAAADAATTSAPELVAESYALAQRAWYAEWRATQQQIWNGLEEVISDSTRIATSGGQGLSRSTIQSAYRITIERHAALGTAVSFCEQHPSMCAEEFVVVARTAYEACMDALLVLSTHIN